MDPAALTDKPIRAPAAGERRGSLVAACALGGACDVAETVHLLGIHLRRLTRTQVLVADAAGGRLRQVAGVGAGSSVSAMARRRGHLRASEVFALGLGGIRIAAGGAREDDPAPVEDVRRVLADARAAHRTTLVDCGHGAADTEALVLGAASHVLWQMPVAGDFEACARALAGRWPGAGKEILVVTGSGSGTRARMSDLTALAATRGAPLVLMPAVGDRRPEDALIAARPALDALRWLLR